MAVGASGLVLLRILYRMENRKRASEIATWDETQFAEESASQEKRGDQRRTFMYGF